MTRPSGGYLTESDGEEDFLDNPDDHRHRTLEERQACITLADGSRSMVLDLMHDNHTGGTRAGHAIGLG